jgi:hypothetical protein
MDNISRLGIDRAHDRRDPAWSRTVQLERVTHPSSLKWPRNVSLRHLGSAPAGREQAADSTAMRLAHRQRIFSISGSRSR